MHTCNLHAYVYFHACMDICRHARAFVRKHLSILKMVPPPELLLYFRVITGVKGMMTRIDAEVNVRQRAEAVCERRGI